MAPNPTMSALSLRESVVSRDPDFANEVKVRTYTPLPIQSDSGKSDQSPSSQSKALMPVHWRSLCGFICLLVRRTFCLSGWKLSSLTSLLKANGLSSFSHSSKPLCKPRHQVYWPPSPQLVKPLRLSPSKTHLPILSTRKPRYGFSR